MEQNRNDTNRRQNNLPQQKGTWDIRPYLSMGLTAILVVLICFAIFFFLYRFQGVSDGVAKVINSITAVIIGFILAYLLSPIMTFFERRIRRLAMKKGELTPKKKRNIRAISVALAMIIFLAIIAVLLMMIVPQIVISVQDLVTSMNDKVAALMEFVDRFTKEDSAVSGQIEGLIGQISDSLEKWLKAKFLSGDGDIFSKITTGVYNAVMMLVDCIIGIIVAVYVLMTKERFVGQAKKLIYAIFRPRFGNMIMDVIHKADEVFGGFFIGKIIDSIIIGCICFVVLYTMKMPYVVLVSVIVGVTNIIPFFGPYIGAIPSMILIFLVSPLKSLYFLIFIIILQQVDGNVIGPKILGNTTGLSPFWVIFSCLLFGGCFGVGGMIFGVPVFAVIYYIIKRLAEHFLKKRNLPPETEKYVYLHNVDIKTNRIKENDTKKQ